MFAVKGWSVPTEKLTSEATGASAAGTGSNSVPVKKRKRPNSKPKIAVTDENVGELWEKFIQNKKPRTEDDKEKKAKTVDNGDKPDAQEKQATSAGDGAEKPLNKRQRQAKKAAERRAALEAATDTSEHQEQQEEDEWNGIDEEPQAIGETSDVEAAEPKTSKKKDKKDKDAKGKEPDVKINKNDTLKRKNDAKPTPKPETAVAPSATAKPAAPKLTPLQAAMREKLISARFRHLNETLYTRPSAEAFELFKTSPDMFVEYHEGFRRQVAVWPENPIDGYIADILARARVKPPRPDRQHRHQREGQQPPRGNKLPLPRDRDGTCTVADLGCGDAKLGAALQPHARKLDLDVRSFDLQTNGNPMITAADMADLPLADGSVDVAVFCLALMGTNWVDFVEEAYRVLRWKGELWVAEIKSRFTVPGKGKKGKVVEHSVGNRRNPGAAAPPAVPGPKSKAGRASKEAEAAAAETDLAIEVDGAEDKRQETDVSAFVDVLAKRGFVLRGEPSESVDLSNKMFVKMYFVKGAMPVKGKGVAAAHARDATYKPRPAKQAKKFIEGDEAEVDEAAVLKPCVYKIR